MFDVEANALYWQNSISQGSVERNGLFGPACDRAGIHSNRTSTGHHEGGWRR